LFPADEFRLFFNIPTRVNYFPDCNNSHLSLRIVLLHKKRYADEK
jgi:hypothetical protein